MQPYAGRSVRREVGGSLLYSRKSWCPIFGVESGCRAAPGLCTTAGTFNWHSQLVQAARRSVPTACRPAAEPGRLHPLQHQKSSITTFHHTTTNLPPPCAPTHLRTLRTACAAIVLSTWKGGYSILLACIVLQIAETGLKIRKSYKSLILFNSFKFIKIAKRKLFTYSPA